jgi:hypothetical protein
VRRVVLTSPASIFCRCRQPTPERLANSSCVMVFAVRALRIAPPSLRWISSTGKALTAFFMAGEANAGIGAYTTPCHGVLRPSDVSSVCVNGTP